MANIGQVGPPRPLSPHADEAMDLAVTLWVSLDLWRFATGRKDLIDRWHDHCEIVVADLMGASYANTNPLDKRK